MDNLNEAENQNLDELLGQRLQGFGKSDDSAPEELHQAVFSTLDTLHFLGELAEFFTVRFTEAEFAIFDAANEAFLKRNK